jgi:hypothetical protein
MPEETYGDIGGLEKESQSVETLNPEQERFAAFVLRTQALHPNDDVFTLLRADSVEQRKFMRANPQFENAWNDFMSSGWEEGHIRKVLDYLSDLQSSNPEEFEALEKRLLV